MTEEEFNQIAIHVGMDHRHGIVSEREDLVTLVRELVGKLDQIHERALHGKNIADDIQAIVKLSEKPL